MRQLNLEIEKTFEGMDKEGSDNKEKRITKRQLIEEDLRKGDLSVSKIAQKHRTAARYVREIKNAMSSYKEGGEEEHIGQDSV